MRASCEATPRSIGESCAARALRSASASALYLAILAPNGSDLPFALMKSSAFFMASSERFSHSSEVSAHVVKPWPPRMHPLAFGFSAAIFAISNPS